MKFRSTRAISVFLLIIFMSYFFVLLSSPDYSWALSESNPRTIRVAQIDLPNFYDRDGQVPIGGYGYDYLKEISDYTGWTYEYIPVTLEQGLKMLKSGGVDLLVPAPASPELQKEFAFSRQEAGLNYSVLCVPAENTETAFNDFSAINGMRVGYVKGENLINSLISFAAAHDFKVEPIPFDDHAALLKALHGDRVDAILTNILEKGATERIITKFAPTPFYFITAKGSPILHDLDSAMAGIKESDPYFNYELQIKYYDPNEYTLPIFTKEEKEYISKAGALKTVYDPAWAPIEYYDEKTGEFTGINADIFQRISQMTGLKFTFIKTDSYSEALSMISNHKADILTGIDNDAHWANQHNLKLTDSYLSASIVLVKNVGAKNLQTAVTALSKDYLAAGEYVKRSSPHSKIIYYDTPLECFEAVNSGKADVTYANSYVAEHLLQDPKLNRLTVAETVNLSDHLCIGISNSMDPILLSILNKAIHGITDTQLNSIIFRHTISQKPEITLEYLIYQYPSLLLAVLLCLFLMTTVTMTAIIMTKNQHNREIRKVAYLDSITGSWNYNKFKVDAQELLRNAKGKKYAVIYLDIHKFSYINDTFGYAVGDLILKEIAGELEQTVKENECFARLAADNFVLLLEYEDDESIAQRGYTFQYQCDARLERINSRYKVQMTSAIYKIGRGESDIPSLVGKADIAHKTIGDIHKASIVFYDDKIQSEFLRKKKLESAMSSSLKSGNFLIYLQPKFDLARNIIVGTEALARWQHPTDGLIMPGQFIPLFESNGFILELDFYVYEKVCQLLRKWIDAGENFMPVSVNVSKAHLANREFGAQLKVLVDRYRIPPELLELELTESMIFENAQEAVSLIRDLKEFGFPILIDDFGSGYSALNLLKDLTVDVLKLDKEFFSKDGMAEKDKIIVDGIIRIARDLNMKILSEGVETQEQVDFLATAGCHMVQGFFFARPMPVEDFERLAGYQV